MFNGLRPCLNRRTDIMHRPKNPSSTLALTALIMAAGTTAHAQFNFMTDQPLNPSETSRRGGRNDNSYYSGQRPIQAAPAAPEPERKGFFGRLFSRDEAPSQAPQPSSYAQPAATYTREGIRYSEPAGYQPAPTPATAQWPAAQPVAPQFQPQTYANPQWPQQPAARPAGAVSSYPIGAEPVGGFAAPAPAPRPRLRPRSRPRKTLSPVNARPAAPTTSLPKPRSHFPCLPLKAGLPRAARWIRRRPPRRSPCPRT